MMDFTESEIRAYYLSRIPGLKWSTGREVRCACPVHQGSDPNFSINAESGLAHCHSQCGKGWDVIAFEQELSGADFVRAKTQAYEAVGRPAPAYEDRDVEATYDYCDESGEVRYQVVRKHGKRFMQRRPAADGWEWGLGKCEPLPFKLASWKDEKFVAIVEGEKDVLSLQRAGIPATCNNGGAGNFRTELAQYFTGKRVAIFPDNDEKGRDHAIRVAEILLGTAESIRIVELPGLPPKGDVSDFLQRGGTRDQIRELYRKAQNWTPEWQFTSLIPDENDKYVKTPEQYISEVGGIDAFWAVRVVSGVPAPWEGLTTLLSGGMRPGEVYVIGANQGAGKTSLALQFIISALRAKTGSLLFSLEMGHSDVFQRCAAIEARVDLNEYRQMMLKAPGHERSKAMRQALSVSTRDMLGWPLSVNTRSGATPEYLISESQRVRKNKKIGLVVVDHMQLMSATGSSRSDYEKFTAISRSCKQVAVDLELPLVLISQTSRSNAHDKRSELECADLRGSGAIEEDAAVVMLLYPDKEDSDRRLVDGTFGSGPVKSWLKVAKNRFGPSGTYIPLQHFKAITRFDPWMGEEGAA
jgi:replicative DNA helicase